MRNFELSPRGPYIKTYSGRVFYLNDPQPEDIHVADIARNLAGINRYTGSSRFSVAQHCVVAALMAEKFYPDRAYLPAQMLIHDADEAYYGDVSSPLKSLLKEYRELEDRAQEAVEEAFELAFIDEPTVKEVDFRMWLTEREILFDGRHGDNDYDGPLKPFPVDPTMRFLFESWGDVDAEKAWLMMHEELFPWLQ